MNGIGKFTIAHLDNVDLAAVLAGKRFIFLSSERKHLNPTAMTDTGS